MPCTLYLIEPRLNKGIYSFGEIPFEAYRMPSENMMKT